MSDDKVIILSSTTRRIVVYSPPGETTRDPDVFGSIETLTRTHEGEDWKRQAVRISRLEVAELAKALGVKGGP